jgi:hypothetical protein
MSIGKAANGLGLSVVAIFGDAVFLGIETKRPD